MKLEIAELHIRNFRSLGDVDGEEKTHIVKLGKRGPILISGEVNNNSNKSNGAGKTTIVEAIIWCLFGCLSDKPRPGDKVINWKSKKDCMVKIFTPDGYEISRCRKYEGHSDLFIKKNGTPIEDGDSTNANAQATLNRLFDLDFGLFISSMFFGQASGSFLSLSDSKKKDIIQNLFGLGKLTYYAQVAKDRIATCEKQYEKIKTKIITIDDNIDKLESDIVKYKSLSEEFEQQKKTNITKYQEEIKKLENDRPEKINIDEIKSFWDLIEKSENKIDELKIKKKELENKLNNITTTETKLTKAKYSLESSMDSIDIKIDNIELQKKTWEEKRGKICFTCGQEVKSGHIDDKIKILETTNKENLNKLEKEKSQIEIEIKENLSKINLSEKAKTLIEDKINKINNNIDKLNKLNKSIKLDKITINEANSHNLICENTDDNINKYKLSIKEELNKQNNYDGLIKDCQNKINETSEEKDKHLKEQEKIGKLAAHLTHIYRAHSDKNKMRSFMISGSIPILNDRLSYYFNELDIDSDIKFNSTLQMVSDRWPYEYHSGGEKKRVDLALMCALYDTFVSIYGQQCNILVLDEIDKELDKDGVDEYIRLIIDDLANRIDTILVISHKDDINYAFPSHIKVSKHNDISILE
jgi:DNA repair exonuclease SbcCD ATPase subunit